jgi:hypothetical protein
MAALALPATAESQLPDAPASAVGQSGPQPGARVRIQAPGAVAGRIVATLVRRSGDTLTLTSDGGATFDLPLARVSSLEVSLGKPRRRGAIRGALIGGPAGLIVRALTNTEHQSCGSRNCALQNDYVLVRKGASPGQLAASTVVGAALGAGIGAWISREAWTPMSHAPRVSIDVSPRGMMTAGFAFAIH